MDRFEGVTCGFSASFLALSTTRLENNQRAASSVVISRLSFFGLGMVAS